MFDTMTLTKIVGGFCGVFLVFLLGNFVAESIYHVGAEDHGDGHGAVQAYTIDTGADDHGGDDAPVEEIDYAAVMAAADASLGEKVFKPCAACHVVGDFGKGKSGPTLDGIVDRQVASVEGFAYSGKLAAVVDVWTAEELIKFLEKPAAYAPGTKMNFKGIKKIENRANLIAWFDSLDG